MENFSDWEKEELRYELRRKLLEKEIRAIEEEESRLFGLAGRVLARLLIRVLRILSGLVVVALAIWLGLKSYAQLSEPLMSQSAMQIIGGICGGLFSLWAVAFACSIAFGSGPTFEQENDRRLEKAQKRVRERPDWQALGR